MVSRPLSLSASMRRLKPSVSSCSAPAASMPFSFTAASAMGNLPFELACCFARDRAHWVNFVGKSAARTYGGVRGGESLRARVIRGLDDAHSVDAGRIEHRAEHNHFVFVLAAFPVEKMLVHHLLFSFIHIRRKARARCPKF